MPSKPKGIIDDLFVPVSRKAANDVRNIVRAAIAAEKRNVIRKKVAQNTQERLERNVKKQINIGDAQMSRPTKKGAKPNAAMMKKRAPLAAERVINTKNTQLRTRQSAKKADRAEANFKSKVSSARSHFPDDKTFQKAWKEEKHSMRTGTPVAGAGRVSKPAKKITKKATTPKSKPKGKK